MQPTHVSPLAVQALRIVAIEEREDPNERLLKLENDQQVIVSLSEMEGRNLLVGNFWLDIPVIPLIASKEELNRLGCQPTADYAAAKLDRDWVTKRIAVVEYKRTNGTSTICILRHINGFEVVGTSATVGEFDEAIGRECAYEQALTKLFEFEAFALLERRATLQKVLHPIPLHNLGSDSRLDSQLSKNEQAPDPQRRIVNAFKPYIDVVGWVA